MAFGILTSSFFTNTTSTIMGLPLILASRAKHFILVSDDIPRPAVDQWPVRLPLSHARKPPGHSQAAGYPRPLCQPTSPAATCQRSSHSQSKRVNRRNSVAPNQKDQNRQRHNRTIVPPSFLYLWPLLFTCWPRAFRGGRSRGTRALRNPWRHGRAEQ